MTPTLGKSIRKFVALNLALAGILLSSGYSKDSWARPTHEDHLSLKKTPPAPLRPQYSEGCILQIVATGMKVVLRGGGGGEIPTPFVYYESATPLTFLQDSVEPWLGTRPETYINAYVPTSNRIFLRDDPSYYIRIGRSIDDSLAREYAHFIQTQYQGLDFTRDQNAEWKAMEIQLWFRTNYVNGSPAWLPEGCESAPRN